MRNTNKSHKLDTCEICEKKYNLENITTETIDPWNTGVKKAELKICKDCKSIIEKYVKIINKKLKLTNPPTLKDMMEEKEAE